MSSGSIRDDIFSQAQEGYHATDHYEKGNIQYNTSSKTSEIRSLGEVFCEYYLNCPSDVGSLAEFLKQENLDKIISEADFQKVICGDAYLSQDSLEFFRLKLPFNITSEKMHVLNAMAKTANKNAERLDFDMDIVISEAARLKKIKDEEREKRYHEYDVQYALIHRDELNQKAREKYHTDDAHRQKVREASKRRYDGLSDEAREKMYSQQREKYANDPYYKERVHQKNIRRRLMERQRMAEDPEYAAMIRKKRTESKRIQRAKQKAVAASSGTAKPSGRGDGR